MATDREDRIWFHPTKFWELTKNMPEDEVEELFNRVYQLAEQRDYAALRAFEFISIGKLKKTAQAESMLTGIGR